ncbi:16S rRNA (guanine(527)-N(7))-methyltransferase RsmG [soil metagenome]
MSAIDDAIQTLSLSLHTGARDLLDGYVTLLMEASTQFNLTAITDLEGIERRLVASSLEILKHIPPQATSLLDVGTGGGVPGMILAIARPDLDVTLLDATLKKVTFLKETAAVLGLANVTTVHGRAEDLSHDLAHRERYAVVTARAVARLATLVELVMPLTAIGGTAILPKGATAHDELDEARAAVGTVGGKNPRAVESEIDDNLFVLIDKIETTPERFPRRAGMPNKRPIGVPPG